MKSIRNVLIAINVRWWNAEAAYALNLARALQATGIRVQLIVNQNSPVHDKANGFDIPVITDIYLDSKSPFVHFRNLRRLLKTIDRCDIEVINSFKSNGSFLFSIARRLRKGICYVKTRGIAAAPRRNPFNQFLYGSRGCDGIIAVGSPVKHWIQRLLGEDSQQNLTVVYYGDSALQKAPPAAVEAMKSQLNIGPDKLVIALLGRTQKVKGHDVALSALKAVEDRRLHLLFLVKDLDEFPVELSTIRDYIQQNNLTDQVTILGFQEQLSAVLSTVDCAIIPSLSSEVNCRVCVEFFSLGIPVIAFPTGTLPDLIDHRQNGFLCDDRDSSSLAAALKWVLENPEEVDRSGAKALNDYNQHYTLENLAEKTVAFFQQCRIHQQKRFDNSKRHD